jgi:excisionase family DNA binding protein
VSDAEDKTRLISMGEAAELYNFTRYHFSQLARRGRLKAQKVGGRWLTTPADVEEYIRSREQRGAFRNDVQVD